MPDRYTLVIVDLYSLKCEDPELTERLGAFEQTGDSTGLAEIAQCDTFSGDSLDACYAQAFHDGWSNNDTVSTWYDAHE